MLTKNSFINDIWKKTSDFGQVLSLNHQQSRIVRAKFHRQWGRRRPGSREQVARSTNKSISWGSQPWECYR